MTQSDTQTAEEKIETALREGADKLDLSNDQKALALTELPESLRELTQLKTLNLDGNSLTSLPDWIDEFEQLRRLWVRHNELATLPRSLGTLLNLEFLDVRDNNLTSLPEWIGHFSHLEGLLASNNHIEALPDSLGGLTRLKFLLLEGNVLSTMSPLIRNLRDLIDLRLSGNMIRFIPSWIGELTSLKILDICGCGLHDLPSDVTKLSILEDLYLGGQHHTPLPAVPECIRFLRSLKVLWLVGCELHSIPDWLSELGMLKSLDLRSNRLTDIPSTVALMPSLERLDLHDNALNPELAAANDQGLDSLRRYFRAKAEAQVVLHEAKLILIGEGEVGKSCLLSALRDEPWVEGNPTTHGIEIKPVKAIDPGSGTEIVLNGWDFGGQRVYRPTHQLFFSAPAVYLVVWKPREGPQQGFVREWIKLVKHREPDAKIIVVATHGGPKERQPDIDRQEVWDLFGKDMVVDFFLVDSKPDPTSGLRKGIADLQTAIARTAAALPEMGRTVPKRWAETRTTLKSTGAAYLALEKVLELCRSAGMGEEETKDFVRISHRLGHLIHYEHDPALRDIVILKPDWLSIAISFVLDDKQTREAHGLVEFSKLGQLWNDPTKPEEFRYEPAMHPLFLRLMERFDLSYRVAELYKTSGGTSLIAQLVPDVRPDPIPGWPSAAGYEDEQAQICRIVETRSGQSAAAEGLFYQLIVRLHKYSLGRVNYADSIHWQRGLVLEDDYGARALLEYAGNDVRITVRSPYPERFLAALTYEVKWLIENFWAGLRCDVMVPCLNPQPCIGLFEVRNLLENKKRNRPEQPCTVCNEWQSIESLLHNAPAARPSPLEELLANSTEAIRSLREVRVQLSTQRDEIIGRFDGLDASSKELVSKVDAAYTGLMRTLLDEAKEGPRLFSFAPVDPGFFDRPKWVSEKFRVTLWCEHSRLPLPAFSSSGDRRGVYDLMLPREWVTKAAPFLKLLVGTLALIVPVAASAAKVALDETSYKNIEKELALGEKSLSSVFSGAQKAGEWLGQGTAPDLEAGDAVRAQGAILRQLHAWLKEKDPGFGGLVRVLNKRHEFLWVHPQFEREY